MRTNCARTPVRYFEMNLLLKNLMSYAERNHKWIRVKDL